MNTSTKQKIVRWVLASITPLLLTVAMFFNSGCTSTGQRIAIEYGTHRIINNEVEIAQSVVDHVEVIRSRVAYTRRATISEMETIIRQEIRWDRMDDDVARILNALISEVAEQLRRRAREEDLLPHEVQLRVRSVLSIVEDTAREYLEEVENGK